MRFKILHTLVGPFTQGRVVDEEMLRDMGADVRHLLSNGAIEQTKDEATPGDVPLGPDNPPGGPHAPIGTTGTAGAPGDAGGAENAHRENLDALTVEQLKERAEAAGVEGFKTMNKAKLIEALKEAEE